MHDQLGEVAFVGRIILVETVFVLALKIATDTSDLKDPDKRARALERAKQLIRDQIAVVTQGVDGLSPGDIQPGLWDLANGILK